MLPSAVSVMRIIGENIKNYGKKMFLHNCTTEQEIVQAWFENVTALKNMCDLGLFIKQNDQLRQSRDKLG